jgi:hypothetical protein
VLWSLLPLCLSAPLPLGADQVACKRQRGAAEERRRGQGAKEGEKREERRQYQPRPEGEVGFISLDDCPVPQMLPNGQVGNYGRRHHDWRVDDSKASASKWQRGAVAERPASWATGQGRAARGVAPHARGCCMAMTSTLFIPLLLPLSLPDFSAPRSSIDRCGWATLGGFLPLRSWWECHWRGGRAGTGTGTARIRHCRGHPAVIHQQDHGSGKQRFCTQHSQSAGAGSPRRPLARLSRA